MSVDKINTMGCTDVFLTWLSWNLDMVGIVGLGSSIPQVKFQTNLKIYITKYKICLPTFYCPTISVCMCWYT